MFDSKCKPYLLEVNHSPSFATDSPLDEKIKGDIVKDTIKLLGLSKERKSNYKKNTQALIDYRSRSGKFIRIAPDVKEKLRDEFEKVRHAYEQENLGSYELIYPCSDDYLMHDYNKML
jgi:tubulin polyglutamylase TTLL6/13